MKPNPESLTHNPRTAHHLAFAEEWTRRNFWVHRFRAHLGCVDSRGRGVQPYTLHPKFAWVQESRVQESRVTLVVWIQEARPYTLHFLGHTLHPTPCTLHFLHLLGKKGLGKLGSGEKNYLGGVNSRRREAQKVHNLLSKERGARGARNMLLRGRGTR